MSTPRLGLPDPPGELGNAGLGDDYLRALSLRLEAVGFLVLRGARSERPSPGDQRRAFIAADTREVFFDLGLDWLKLASFDAGGNLAVPAGLYVADDVALVSGGEGVLNVFNHDGSAFATVNVGDVISQDGGTLTGFLLLTAETIAASVDSTAGRDVVAGRSVNAELDHNADRDVNAGRYATAAGKPLILAEERLRTVRGTVNAQGAVTAGAGFSVQKIGTGNYRVTLAAAMGGAMSPTATPLEDYWFCRVSIESTSAFRVEFRNPANNANGDTAFTFHAIGPA